jgi:predicted  nucleic acid-binding Zn-ribbon protein
MSKKNGSVKAQLQNLDKGIIELKQVCRENRKTAEALRTELSSLNLKAIDKFKELTKLITEDLKNLESEFGRTKTSDSNENKFIGQQINSLTKDKTKLIESYNIADGRLKICEKEIGVNDIY